MAQSLLVLVALFVLAIFEQGEDRILVLFNECFVQISDDVV